MFDSVCSLNIPSVSWKCSGKYVVNIVCSAVDYEVKTIKFYRLSLKTDTKSLGTTQQNEDFVLVAIVE